MGARVGGPLFPPTPRSYARRRETALSVPAVRDGVSCSSPWIPRTPLGPVPEQRKSALAPAPAKTPPTLVAVREGSK